MHIYTSYPLLVYVSVCIKVFICVHDCRFLSSIASYYCCLHKKGVWICGLELSSYTLCLSGFQCCILFYTTDQQHNPHHRITHALLSAMDFAKGVQIKAAICVLLDRVLRYSAWDLSWWFLLCNQIRKYNIDEWIQVYIEQGYIHMQVKYTYNQLVVTCNAGLYSTHY